MGALKGESSGKATRNIDYILLKSERKKLFWFQIILELQIVWKGRWEYSVLDFNLMWVHTLYRDPFCLSFFIKTWNGMMRLISPVSSDKDVHIEGGHRCEHCSQKTPSKDHFHKDVLNPCDAPHPGSFKLFLLVASGWLGLDWWATGKFC